MKTNFIVSMHRTTWLAGARNLFLADSYLYHLLEKNGELGNFDAVQIAQPFRQTREEFVSDHEYVDAKLRKYSPILAARLDRIHGTNFGEWFWRKCISLSLLRQVTLCFYTFQTCEKYLRLEEHDCRILSGSSCHIPRDFNEHYTFFQVTDYAQEQLFSVYARLFHPGIFEEVEDRYIRPVKKAAEPKPANTTSLERTFEPASRKLWQYVLGQIARLKPTRIWRKILRMTRTTPPSPLPPTVGIFGSYFKREYFDQLFQKSRGRVQQIQLKMDFPSSESVDWKKRNVLAATDVDCDRFDRFFFESLRCAIPKAFVEDWNEISGFYREHFRKFTELRYVTCENWISNMYSSVALAVLRQQGVKHIYNEHNYLPRPFLGNSSKYLLPMVDIYATLGWYEQGIPNLLRAGSLFNWVEQTGAAKDVEIMFFASLPRVRPAEISACYGESGAINVARYFEFNKRFFSGLSEDTLSTVVYRMYPAAAAARLGGAYDEAYVMREVLAKVGRVDDSSTPGNNLMQRARLIVVNYLATTFLQALLADIPTVFFLNKATRYLDEHYQTIFDGLIRAGICQTDPEAAATFIESIKSSPEEWWLAEPVRQARQKFIDEYLGPPEVLLEYLLDCATPH